MKQFDNRGKKYRALVKPYYMIFFVKTKHEF